MWQINEGRKVKHLTYGLTEITTKSKDNCPYTALETEGKRNEIERNKNMLLCKMCKSVYLSIRPTCSLIIS